MAMPKHYFKDEYFNGLHSDSKWIGEQIDMLPIALQSKVAKRYSDIYQQLVLEESKNSVVRRRANTWLRITVNKYKVTQQEGYF